jgi:hypothetical protein
MPPAIRTAERRRSAADGQSPRVAAAPAADIRALSPRPALFSFA